MRILLTGATGFIGSHVARELLRRGHEVHITTRSTSDLRRIEDLQSELRIWHTGRYGLPVEADAVLHLAWYADPKDYRTSPVNRQCLEDSLQLLSRVQGRAVFIGTCFEHDLRMGVLREESPTRPTTLYAECKDTLRRVVELRPNSAWIRLFYQYGPWEDERRLMPAVILGQLKGQPSKVTPGDQRFDYLPGEDVASAVVAVTESRLQGCVNVGSGAAASLREIVSRIAALGGRPELIQWGAYPQKPDDPMLIEADNAKLRSTGWAPRYDLERGLRHTFDWWKGRSGT